MNDKQLFKMCLTYLQRGTQPIARGDLIKLLQARLLQCSRCGKKLGTEVTDIHTCTPKQPEDDGSCGDPDCDVCV